MSVSALGGIGFAAIAGLSFAGPGLDLSSESPPVPRVVIETGGLPDFFRRKKTRIEEEEEEISLPLPQAEIKPSLPSKEGQTIKQAVERQILLKTPLPSIKAISIKPDPTEEEITRDELRALVYFGYL